MGEGEMGEGEMGEGEMGEGEMGEGERGGRARARVQGSERLHALSVLCALRFSFFLSPPTLLCLALYRPRAHLPMVKIAFARVRNSMTHRNVPFEIWEGATGECGVGSDGSSSKRKEEEEEVGV
jgi:hypothetical protein